MPARRSIRFIRPLPALALAAGMLSALLSGCEGSATQTTTGAVNDSTGMMNHLHGRLVDEHGRPVAGVKVKAWLASASPNGLPGRADSLSQILAESDAKGAFAFKGLEAGIYNVFGEKEANGTSVFNGGLTVAGGSGASRCNICFRPIRRM